MASLSEAIDRLQKVFLASTALTVRRLREAAPDMLPVIAAGMSRNAPQVEPRHLTNIILAQAAHLPIDGAAAVLVLRDLPFTGAETLTSPGGTSSLYRWSGLAMESLAGETLGQMLDAWIDAAADPQMRAGMEDAYGHDWTLTVCPDAAFALMSQRQGNATATARFGQPLPLNRAQRLVNLPFEVITASGELVQTSHERRATTNQHVPKIPARNPTKFVSFGEENNHGPPSTRLAEPSRRVRDRAARRTLATQAP